MLYFLDFWHNMGRRFYGIWSRPNQTPFGMKMKITIMLLVKLLAVPFWVSLWYLDDIFFFRYRRQKIVQPIFFLAGARTGSTSLHRMLAKDEQFIWFQTHELLFPFISMGYLFDYLKRLDARHPTWNVMGKMMKALSPPDEETAKELAARHPSELYAADEEDLFFSMWFGCGFMTDSMYPVPPSAYQFVHHNGYSKKANDRMFLAYRRLMQKVMYRRGGGGDGSKAPKIFLSKSHCIDLADRWKTEFPDCKFCCVVRHPKNTLCSYVPLAEVAIKFVLNYDIRVRRDQFVPYRLELVKSHTQQEMKFFLDSDEEENRKHSKFYFRYLDFLKDPSEIVQRFYTNFALTMSGDYTTFMQENVKEKPKYERVEYKNPTLEELGVTEEVMQESFGEYIRRFELEEG